ncbi:MAG: HNH endonuclease signature motif containing protein, partial [Nitriliruptorales bacterium]
KSRKAKRLPTKVKWAVRARDIGDRFPGSDLPATASEYHHIRPQAWGIDHDPDNVILLGASRHNALIHRRGWTQHLDPHTGVYTIERDGRVFRSLPARTRLEPAPDHQRDGPHGRERDGPDP